ncbi:MAG: S-layer homology domain-containing protein [Cyanobacteria bacterium P01_H01_bin.152]
MKNGKITPAIAGILTLGLLAGCAGSSIGNNVQQSLEADPQLEDSPPFEDSNADVVPDSTAAIAETATAAGEQTTAENDFSDLSSPSDDFSTDESDDVDETQTIVALNGVPADLQTYIRDLQALEQISLTAAANGDDADRDATQSTFTQTITRREYARWLFESYNAIYADEPGDRLRAGHPSDAPAFQDVAPEDPDFAMIQGLAEAGIVPSAFTGDSTDVNFRPDAPLTRADLILWKVPLDLRAALPTTTAAAVTTAWGFQDADSIEPLALRAIAADFQLGDFANFRRAFGYTTLFRPDKAVTRAEAASVLWRFGTQTDGITAADIQNN